MTPKPPLIVDRMRGNAIESSHRIFATLVNFSGKILEGWGDINRVVFPRSCIKPFQTISLIESGASQYFKITEKEIALACGSHGGNQKQIKLLRNWLKRLKLGMGNLACGKEWPRNTVEAVRLQKNGKYKSKIYNTCSGKHLAMLTTSLYFGDPIIGYSDKKHPTQVRIIKTLKEITEYFPQKTTLALDDCGTPTMGFPLYKLAQGVAKITDEKGHAKPRKNAIRKIIKSIKAHHEMLAWCGNIDSTLTKILPNSSFIKSGAEGICLIAFPKLKMGLAIKVEDGLQQAVEMAAVNIISKLELAKIKDYPTMKYFLNPAIINSSGNITGKMQIRGF